MSEYEVGDRVTWRSSTVAGRTFGRPEFTVTETGLESLIATMPGEQLRVRRPDGTETRVWVEDIERAPEGAPETGPGGG